MTRTAEPLQTSLPATSPTATSSSTVEQNLNWLKGKFTCPFCGTVTDRADEACARCGMHDTSANREATKARIGPWYVLQSRNPAAPGMTYATLMLLVKKNLVTARSIVRGPTTHQLWTFAANVRGLSREFGVCWSCSSAIEKSALLCNVCEQSQKPPASAEDLVERPGQEPRVESVVSDEGLPVETTNRAQVGAMDIVLPTPSDNTLRTAVPSDGSELVVSDEEEVRVRSVNGKILSDEELKVASKRHSRYADESVFKRYRQIFGVLLLTSTIVFVFALFLFPNFRQQTLYWANTRFEPVMEKWRAWGDSNHIGTDAPVINPDGTPIEPVKRENRPKPGYVPRGTSPVLPPSDPSAEAPSIPTPSAPRDPARRASATMIDDLITQNLISNLNKKAKDAEARGDYKAAQDCFDQMHAVPERFWPDDLQERINVARAKMKRP